MVGLIGAGTEILIWIGLILSLILAVYVTAKHIVIGIPGIKLVQFVWLIPLTFFVVLFLDGLFEYILMNKEIPIVLGFLIGVYLYMFPTEDNNKNKRKK